MHVIKRGDKRIRVEGFYKSKGFLTLPKIKTYSTKWVGQDMFIMKLRKVEQNLRQVGNFHKYDRAYPCQVCNSINSAGYYQFADVRWGGDLTHYIEAHNVRVSDEFKNEINNFKVKTNIVSRITTMASITVTRNGINYITLNKNQLHILDALMHFGGYEKKYHDENKNKLFRYSEHSGVLDFNNNGLEKIIVSAVKSRVDTGDEEIYLPGDMDDAIDYEYIFHTHPPTPIPGARAKFGVLFEFPSLGDLFHFMDHYNDGITQGSIVIAPEGMYVIRKQNLDDRKITIDEKKFRKDIVPTMRKTQQNAIEKYGTDFELNIFYSKIAQDTTWIDQINKVLNRYHMHIDYYPRVQNINKQWILKEVVLPVYAVEISRKRIPTIV